MRAPPLVSMHLRFKDTLLLGAVLGLMLVLAGTTYLGQGETLLVLTVGIATCLLITVQLEIFRRLEAGLAGVKDRYLVMDITDVIRTRRSIRRFAPHPVSREDVRIMLDAARWAPIAGLTQPWRFIVIRDRDLLARMEEVVREQIDVLPRAASYRDGWRRSSLFFSHAPVTIAVLLENRPELFPDRDLQYLMEKTGRHRSEARDYMGRVDIMTLSAAIQNLLLAAHALGYGACWLRVPYMAKADLEELLGVTPPWELAAIIPVGRAAHSPSPPPRTSVEEIATFRW